MSAGAADFVDSNRAPSPLGFGVTLIFLDGLVTFVVFKNVRSECSQFLSFAVVAGVAHEDVVPIIERLRKLA